jgi:NAD(P)-dependent dehydrogenase (short-subunit alcohol dehydrogenase family)
MTNAGVPTVFTYLNNETTALALERELRDAGHNVWARRMDMRDNGSIDETLCFAQAEVGTLHTVLCPAGARVPFNRIVDFTVDDVERFILSDGLAAHRLVNRVVPVMRANGSGRIVLCSTMAFRRVVHFDGISPLSKGIVEALVRQVAVEEAAHAIRCNAVAIGWVMSRSVDEVRKRLPPDPSHEPSTPNEMFARVFNTVAAMPRIPRPATPVEAGDVFAFLASDQAAYVTGQVIMLDGGATL